MEPKPLLDAITQRAHARRDSALTQAREDAEALVAQARQETAAQRESVLSETRAGIQQADREERERANAEMERATLTLRETVAEEVLGQVADEIRRVVSGPEFPALLALLIAEVLEEASPECRLLVPPDHASSCRDMLLAQGKSNIAIVPEPAMWDGVALEDASRSFRLTNTLRARFANREQDARKICLTTLFPERDPHA